MNCDDIALFLVASDMPTLTAEQETELHRHIADCATCRELTFESASEQRQRCIVRIPEDALDDRDLLVLPTVDPIVFLGEEELARGGMGRITRARDRRLGRDVAIKEVLVPHLRARFEREVAITSQLQHPAIVPIYEAGTWPDGSAFYTMRLVPGGTLAHAVAEATTLAKRLALLPNVIAAVDALAYAHSRHIVHRDLKPGNILVGEFGETVVIDWGLAKELHRKIGDAADRDAPSSPELTRAGAVMGTPGFMSPEQAAGEPVDERTDVYALGAILYNVLAGHPPYEDTPLAELAPETPDDLRAIVHRAMARDPAARFPSAKELADELRRFGAGQLLRSRAYGMRELFARWVRRHRTAVAVGAIALVIVAIVAVSAIVGITRSRAAERDAREVAEQAQAAAEANVVTLLEEQGRSQLLAGDRERAFAYLGEAYARGRDTVALRHLLGEATRDFDLLDRTVEASEPIATAGFTAGDALVTVTTGSHALITTWARGTSVTSHPLAGHVIDARLSADGRRVAVLARDGLALHDVASGAKLWAIADRAIGEPGIVFDAAGKRVAIVPYVLREQRTVEVRDVDTGAIAGTLATVVVPLAAAFSPDGTQLAVAGNERLGVWNIGEARPFQSWSIDREMSSVAFVGDRQIVTGTDRREAALWTLGDGRVTLLPGHIGPVTAVAASARGDLVATADVTGFIRLWNEAGHNLEETRDHRGEVAALRFSPDGRFLIAGGADKQVFVWDARSFELYRGVASRREHALGAIRALAWTPDGARFASVRDDDRHGFVWRVPVGHRTAQVAARASTIAAGFAVADDRDELVLYRLDTGAAVRRIPHATVAADALPHVAANRDGTRLVSWTLRPAARVSIYDATTGAELAAPALVQPQPDLRMSDDGRTIVEFPSLTRADARARVIDATTGALVRELPAANIADAALSPDGDRVALVFDGLGEPTLWSTSTGRQLPLPKIDNAPLHAKFDAGGKRLAFYGVNATRIVDTDTATVVASLATVGIVDTAEFDDGGHRIATTTSDRAARLWNAETGAVLVAVEGVARGATALTRDGARYATGFDDGTISIWDAPTGRLLETIRDHTSGIAALAWSADGSRLVTQSTELGTATIWDVHVEQRSPRELAELAERAGRWKLVDGSLVAR